MNIYDKLDDLVRIRYPFVEDTRLQYTNGVEIVELPDSLFLDMSVSAYAGTTPDCRLLAVKSGSDGFISAQLSICGTVTEVSVPASGVLCSVPFMAAPTISGRVLFGNAGLVALAATLAADVWYDRVDAGVGLFERRCVVFSPDGEVLSITGDAPGSSAVVGAVEVVDGINTRVRVDVASRTVTILAAPGVGLPNCYQRISGTGEGVLRVFNGVEPDATGSVTVPTDGKLRLAPGEDGSELELSIADDIACLVDCAPTHEVADNPLE